MNGSPNNKWLKEEDPIRLLVAAVMLLCMGGILLAQLLAQKDLYFINKIYLGLDYNDIYSASACIASGSSPYDITRYVTPPIPALFGVPLTLLPFEEARVFFVLLTGVCMLLALYVAHRMFASFSLQDDARFLLFGFFVISFSYPFYFLFDRGNIDSIVLLFMCLGIYSLGRKDWIAGIFLALAIVFKVYPVLVVFPLLIGRRWKALAFLALTLALLFLIVPEMWMTFIKERLQTRSNLFRPYENGSLACALYYIGFPIHAENFLFDASGIIYVVFLTAIVSMDFKLIPHADTPQLRAMTLMYAPFMIAIPQLAYCYELVCLLALIPVVSWLWQGANTPTSRRWLILIAVGIALSQFQAVAAEKLFKTVTPRFVPGFGLLLVMVGVTGYKGTLLLAAGKSTSSKGHA